MKNFGNTLRTTIVYPCFSLLKVVSLLRLENGNKYFGPSGFSFGRDWGYTNWICPPFWWVDVESGFDQDTVLGMFQPMATMQNMIGSTA
jgi:hypothetical protein